MMLIALLLSFSILLIIMLTAKGPIARKKRSVVFSVNEVRLCTLSSLAALENTRLLLRRKKIPFREATLSAEASFRLSPMNHSPSQEQAFPPIIIFVPRKLAPLSRKLITTPTTTLTTTRQHAKAA
jgi:hypothetical protein